ncbi:MAG: SDR family NAD(P)-dependent oxidoreductase [Anaerolineaceae bacterium]|nr:SDR family NAD(P)-dependent oxidoreductase [Anaerolineaceae bacterium]
MKSYVLITGAAGGLGKAFAAECAARGWDLFLTDLRADLLAPLAAGLQRLYGVDVLYIPGDLTDQASRQALWEEIGRLGLRFHFLFNVAGSGDEGAFIGRNPDNLRALLRLNVEATVAMSRQVLAFRDPAQDFHIVNVSSLAGFYPMPYKAVYAASKRFVLDFSLALHEELKPLGVSVTVLCPAGLPTHNASIRRILGQGLIGQLTTVNVGDAAAQTVEKALAGRSIVIPGFLNRVFRWAGAWLSPQIAARLIGKRWQRLQGQHLHE